MGNKSISTCFVTLLQNEMKSHNAAKYAGHLTIVTTNESKRQSAAGYTQTCYKK